MPTPLWKKGQSGNPKGSKPGSGVGRPSDNTREFFREMLNESGAHERFKKIMQTTNDDDLFLKYYQEAMNRAEGKPAQAVNVGVADDSMIKFATAILEARKERGLPD